jgi:hypothetical protein
MPTIDDQIYCCKCSGHLTKNYFFSGYEFFCDDCTPDIINQIFLMPAAFRAEQIEALLEELHK